MNDLNDTIQSQCKENSLDLITLLLSAFLPVLHSHVILDALLKTETLLTSEANQDRCQNYSSMKFYESFDR